MPGTARLGEKKPDLRARAGRSGLCEGASHDNLIDSLHVGPSRGDAWLISVGSIQSQESVLHIRPRQSPLRCDRKPVVVDAGEIERLGHTGGIPAQQKTSQAETLRVNTPAGRIGPNAR